MLLVPVHLQAADGDGPAARRKPFLRLVYVMSARNGVDPRLVDAIIRTESSYRPEAVSRAGAVGLMQLMPGILTSYGVLDPFDPAANIDAGARYLRGLLDEFGIRGGLAAYNAGAGSVRRFGGVPPYPETHRFVERVLRLVDAAR